MILNKDDILNYIRNNQLKIKPFALKHLHGIGIDLRIFNKIFRLQRKDTALDTHSLHDLRQYYNEETAKSFVINPGEHILASTIEEIELPADLTGLVLLRSTYARLGLLLSVGLVSPGFRGQLTLEIIGGTFPVRICAGDAVFCITFLKLASETNRYEGKYQGQKGPTMPILDWKSFLDAVAGLINHHYKLRKRRGNIDLKRAGFMQDLANKDPQLGSKIGKFKVWFKAISNWRDTLIHRHGILLFFTQASRISYLWNQRDLLKLQSTIYPS